MPNFHNLFEKVKNIKVTNKQRKPDPKKNFFENYSDHLDMLEINFQKGLKSLDYRSNFSDLMYTGFFSLLDPKHLLILDALRDGHDYMDEFLGTTVVPIISLLASVASLGLAIYEGAQKLTIATGLQKDDHEDHGYHAVNYLAASGAALAVAVASFIKSLISLVSRPIVTMVQGWKPQDVNRFYNDSSLEAEVEKGIDSVLNGLF